jgi:hypothetical protein
MTALPPVDHVVLERILNAAGGYAELGLNDMAWEEIHSLAETDRARPDVMEFTLSLLIRESRWEEVVAAGRPLCADPANPPSVFLHTAFALHEMGLTPEARAILLAGPESLRSDPLFHYNMACYLATAGEIQDAEVCLRTAFRMDPKLRVHAATDPDLLSLQGVV